jgi:hypothetical protein
MDPLALALVYEPCALMVAKIGGKYNETTLLSGFIQWLSYNRGNKKLKIKKGEK